MTDPIVERQQQTAILYDPQWRGKISAQWFDAAYWQQAARPIAEGRGGNYFIDAGDQQWVLRHYHRGGLMASLLGDRYFWSGLEQTRPWREWRLLDRMFDMGLPVPRPVAARVSRHGLFYRGDLLVELIVDAVPLSRLLQAAPLDEPRWQAIGVCLRRFHVAGIYHADLNAHNLLIRGDEVFVIDFDKGAQRRPGPWQQHNLQRLHRSLLKLKNLYSSFEFGEMQWQALLHGYNRQP